MKLLESSEGIYQLLTNRPELLALLDSLDCRLRDGTTMNAAEHKLWEVARAVLIGGEDEYEMDNLSVRVKQDATEHNHFHGCD